mgnify:CR=1 FL=1
MLRTAPRIRTPGCQAVRQPGRWRPIPQRAVKLAADAASVMVLDAKNNATPRPVKLGTMVSGQWAILDGLKPGDRVIVDGLQKVQPGQPVRVAQPKGRASAPASKR